MRITLAQINPTIADFQGNLEKIEKALTQARSDDSDLVVFPAFGFAFDLESRLVVRVVGPREVDPARRLRVRRQVARCTRSDAGRRATRPRPYREASARPSPSCRRAIAVDRPGYRHCEFAAVRG